MNDDLKTLPDSDLADHLDAVLAELERRQRLANAPAQIAAISAAFLADGGDREALVSAIPE